MAPFFTPEWGEIPAKRRRIHPRAKPVAFCCRGKDRVSKQLFEELLEEEEGHLDTFRNIKDHADKLGASYLATLAS